jgi:hypothetical protein
MIEKISYKDIPDNFLEKAGESKFSLYPYDFNGVLFHHDRWKIIDETKMSFWGIVSNGVLQSILEFHLNDYDTNLLGVKAGTIQNIFTNPELRIEQKRKAWQELIEAFQVYRKNEEIKFCFIAVDNWESDLSLLLQQNGFRYILTWGKCFLQKVQDIALPEGYIVRTNKEEKDLPYILEMADSYFKGGRFYLDPNIGSGKADKMYKDLIISSYNNSKAGFIVLYNLENIPVGCIVSVQMSYKFNENIQAPSVRLVVFNKTGRGKGLASAFLSATSAQLLEKSSIIESGVEMHNLASVKMHFNAGYKINQIYSAYHSWV